jgi:hypothetical protein
MENPKKPQKYTCNLCYFVSSNKKDYARHLQTRKHVDSHNGNNLETKKPQKTPKYTCICEKQFITHSGLWKHKNKCIMITSSVSDKINIVDKNTINDNNNEIKTLTTIVLDIVKQNQDLTNKMVDICKNTSNGTTINNINSNNKTFNLNVFLNEECKDAMNIMEFVDSLKLQLCDLESVGKLGFVEGISNIIIQNLKALEINKRPLHCSDLKRETMYVKDENKWEKENVEKNKLRKAIKYIAHKNTKLLTVFRDKYPDCVYSDSKNSDKYNSLIIESMGGRGDNDSEKENKIIKNIAKEVMIVKD